MPKDFYRELTKILAAAGFSKLKAAKVAMRDGRIVKQEKLLQCRVLKAVILRMKF